MKVELQDQSVEAARLVVLISGSGTNLQAILDAIVSGQLAARVVAVVSDQIDAFGLERARRSGVNAVTIPFPRKTNRRLYDARLADVVQAFSPDWVVLAGWMRLLKSPFLSRFPNRVINLHPALPGAFPGAHAIVDAYDAFCAGLISQTGVMVHWVPDETVDAGPVLAQEAVPIVRSDTLVSLEQRIHAVEHRLLVSALVHLVSQRIQVTAAAR